ncbi:fluoride efflux transporter FluC [Levilactobacillus suantsaiihabitans]|uniref:Fluoride-specific ion channel FluC n=1 Tax=Levilactobacillus suantsaiihabitans TaxID=2487722 RepID=A0A4Z0JED9_9LACO|nr:CrcB family protein [Levilactobacillus suantsaiihabitans]
MGVTIISIIFFAFIGGSSRYLLGQLVPVGTGFPWMTLVINLTGSGVLAWLSHAKRLTANWPTALTVGLGVGGCGAFTTFSTFGVETVRLITAQKWGLASGYVLATLLGGACCSAAGVWIARRWGTFRLEEQ